MEFREFKDYVCSKVMDELGEEYSYRLLPTLKNNSTVLTGFSVTKGNANIAPTIYMEHFYDSYNNGASLSEIITSMVEIFKKCIPDFDINIEDIRDYDKVSDRLFLKVVNYSKNEVLAEDAPHIKIMDLCILFYCVISDRAGETASTLVKNDLYKDWGITKEKLFERALFNTKTRYGMNIMNMKQVLSEMVLSRLDGEVDTERFFRDLQGEDFAPMYVITNREKTYGASCILYTDELSKLAEELDSDLYILPCSIHELIAIPDYGDTSPDSLRDMVREVNRTEVGEAEILSDNVYRFDRKDTCIYSVYSA